MLLEKPRFGAFTGTDLEQTLHARGINTIIITGIQTNICCDTTAREAFSREFHVFFVSDATTTSDDEDEGISAAALQRATLYSLGIFAQIITLNEMITKIQMAARVSPVAAP